MAQHSNAQPEFEEKVIQISRVSKKTSGGNKMGFSILMVVGDKKGKVGVGLGKAGDVMSAMRKGAKKAKKKMIEVPMDGTTIPFSLTVKKGAGQVLLKPSPRGSGVIAGGPVRAVVEAAGIRDISAKILGSDNQASSVYATFEALKRIKKLVDIKGIQLRSIADIEAEEAQKQQEMQAKAKAKEAKKDQSKQEKNTKKVAKDPSPKTKKSNSVASDQKKAKVAPKKASSAKKADETKSKE